MLFESLGETTRGAFLIEAYLIQGLEMNRVMEIDEIFYWTDNRF
jgi:hypothetical protein